MKNLILNPGKLSYGELRRWHDEAVGIELSSHSHEAIQRAADTVASILRDGRAVYGINTGFGKFATTRIPDDELTELQRSIVLSHAAGVGEYMSDAAVRLMLVLKINALAQGYSGVRPALVEALIRLVNCEIYPCVPIKGSVGASGDLAPLAHMSTVLLGEGFARHGGEVMPAAKALELAGLAPVELAPKEGLALLNGTQASTALALEGLFLAENAIASAVVTGALSVEAACGSRVPFDERIHLAQGHQSVIRIGAAFRELLDHSEIEESHRDCGRVQDPYSLRCQPQVMGACLQQTQNAARVILTEANSVSDNPLVFPEEGEILSGGNFHAEAIAMAADNLALALAEVGALSERRIALLIDGSLSGLPPFLVEHGGTNSGFMMAQVTAASLASENKSFAHPASVDSLPTSANQEDHVSMSMFAARRLREMHENTVDILAIEWLAAVQGLDFLLPLRTSAPLERARSKLRERVPFYDRDRYFAPDIETAAQMIHDGQLQQLVTLQI